MTLTLSLPPELESRLSAGADLRGLPMEEYTLEVLKQGVAAEDLSARLDALAMRGQAGRQKPAGWQSTVGAFSGPDPAMDRILDAGKAIRDAERSQE